MLEGFLAYFALCLEGDLVTSGTGTGSLEELTTSSCIEC